MRMSLLTNDRKPIPPHNWLQFDMKNYEFYGVPLREDIGRKEYQLVVTDKEGTIERKQKKYSFLSLCSYRLFIHQMH